MNYLLCYRRLFVFASHAENPNATTYAVTHYRTITNTYGDGEGGTRDGDGWGDTVVGRGDGDGRTAYYMLNALPNDGDLRADTVDRMMVLSMQIGEKE